MTQGRQGNTGFTINGDEAMTTRLTEPLRREIEIDGDPFTVLFTRAGFLSAGSGFGRGAWSPGGRSGSKASSRLP